VAGVANQSTRTDIGTKFPAHYDVGGLGQGGGFISGDRLGLEWFSNRF